MPLTDVALVGIAGGRGRRMGGVVKPLMRHPDGRTLLERLLGALEPVAGPATLVAPDVVGARLTAVVDRPCLPDPGLGPHIALAEVARALDAEWLAVSAADWVRVDPEALRTLLGRRAVGVDAVVPIVAGYAQPLFAVYRRAAIGAAGRSLRERLAVLRTIRVGLPDDAMLDVDTPEDARRHGLSI